MGKKIVILFLFSFWLKTNAQENWTLKQCIEYGLKNNRNNTIYTNEKLAADARAKEVLADYLPRVSLTSTLDNNLKLQQSVIPAGIFGPDEMRVSLTQKYNSNFVGQLDQVIYDHSLITGLKANKYNKQQAELNIEQSQEAIIYNISMDYFQIFVYNQQLEVLEYNKVTYEKQINIYSLQVSKGVVLQKDLDKVSVDYNNTISQIRVARSNLQLAENELKYEMGYPISDPLAVDISTEMASPTIKDNSDTFTPASKINYKLSELNIKVLEINQSRIRAEAYPKLTGYFRYGAVGFGDNLNGAYEELLPYSAVGLKLSIPILDFYKRNAQYKQAKISRINAEENLKIMEARYKVDYENANTKVLQAQINVENDKRNVTLAESVLNITDLQFQKGITNLTDWLNTQNSLKEAQSSYLNSLYNYYQARIDLEKAAGTLKTFYNSL
ncbi:TolC family protein [Flavobacterium cheongpyeongense]|uniref:TolC family protein n=1 Tax=Flavobacterium cheongpyeongense TaxID=2212651 RepID=A0A2V4BY64_9FLAO|nr:TolC family protein [Flavobacterium cheongpyeongense]PXY42803.1 TolC family protein [Flavobacterium cheongpyeongense]